MTRRQTFYEKNGWLRVSRPTPSEARRIAESWTGRIGADLREQIRALSQETGLSQGAVAVALMRYGLAALASGELQLNQNGREDKQ